MNTKDLDLQEYNHPLQDSETYLARVVGICYLGHQNPPASFISKHARVQPRILISFEFIDERTCISKDKPLIMSINVTLSDNPRSKFYKIVEELNKGAIKSKVVDIPFDEYEDKDTGQRVNYEIDISKILYELADVTIYDIGNGRFIIKTVESPSDMQKSLHRDCPITTPWMYDLVEDKLFSGNREDLPKGLLKNALTTLVE